MASFNVSILFKTPPNILFKSLFLSTFYDEYPLKMLFSQSISILEPKTAILFLEWLFPIITIDLELHTDTRPIITSNIVELFCCSITKA